MKKLVLLTSLILSGCLFLLTLSTSAQCPNLNFSMGNFNNWQGYMGSCGSGVNINPSAITPGRHTIMDGAQLLRANQLYDERCLKIKKVPDGFAYAAKIGNESTGAEMEAIEYTLRVDSNSSLLLLHFAWVMEDPSHSYEEQPRFTLTIKDSVGNPISNNVLPCAFYDFVAGAGATGLACDGAVQARDWTTVGYSLEPMIGRTIKIYFETRDCTLSGHYGYAYVVAECRSMTIDLQYCEGQTAARFRAPDGFQKYTWTRSIGKPSLITSGSGRNYQNITLTDAYDEEIITCEAESALSPECSATLKTVVRKTFINATFGYGVMEYGEVDFRSHNNQNWYDTCNRTATFVDRSKVVNSKQSSRSWMVHGLNMGFPNDSMVTITFPDPGLATPAKDSVRYLVRLTVGAENGCVDTSQNTASHYITIYASPRVEIEGVIEMCQGSTEPLAAKTVRSRFIHREWTWYDASGIKQTSNDSIIYITDPATYYLESIDVNGCIVRDTHIVTHLNPQIEIIVKEGPSCFGGNDGRFEHGPMKGGRSPYQSFTWSVSDTNMWPLLNSPWTYDPLTNTYIDPYGNTTGKMYSDLPAGSYNFEAIDMVGCLLKGTIEIYNPPLLELFADHEPTTCGDDNGTIILTATGGTPPYTYSVEKDGKYATIIKINNGDSVKATGLDTGTYNISVTDVGGNTYGTTCTTSDTITVTAIPAPYLDITTKDETCESKNGSISIRVVNGSSPIKFIWGKDTLINENNRINLAAGDHNVKIIDALDCLIDTTIKVDAYPTPTVSVAVTPETCERGDGTITLTVNSALPNTLKYEWSGRTETSPGLTGLTAGTYNVTIRDSFCVVQETIEVPHIDGPIADFQTTTYSVPSNSNFVLTDISKGTVNTWNWDMGDGNTQTGKIVYYSYGMAGDYVIFLQVIDENNCTDTTSKVMHVYDELTVFIPNMFTPNGDNLNEIWIPAMTEYVEEGYQLSVFDRWGQRIFHTTDPKEGWNGTGTDGKIVANNTVYSYRLIVRDFAGQEYEFVGQITVIK